MTDKQYYTIEEDEQGAVIQVKGCDKRIITIPIKEFCRGYKEFEKRERRDSIYEAVMCLVTCSWHKNDMRYVAKALDGLLLTWNQAFYRYGRFSFDKLEECIKENFQKIKSFRKRDISSLKGSDMDDIKDLFKKFLNVLQIESGKKKGKTSPVAVAKALHLLSPKFFPLWDNKIARAYGCNYNRDPAEKYFLFCKITRVIAEKVKNYDKIKNHIETSGKTVVKLIDEYNYSKYTKGWIKE